MPVLLLGYMQVGYGYTHEFKNNTTNKVVTVSMGGCGNSAVSSVSSIELQPGAAGTLESSCKENQIVNLSWRVGQVWQGRSFQMTQTKKNKNTPKWEIYPRSNSLPVYLGTVEPDSGWSLDDLNKWNRKGLV